MIYTYANWIETIRHEKALASSAPQRLAMHSRNVKNAQASTKSSLLLPQALALALEVLLLLGISLSLSILVLQRLNLVAKEELSWWQAKWLRSVAVPNSPWQSVQWHADALHGCRCTRSRGWRC